MSLVIVPNTLHDAIHAAIDRALNGRPCSAESRAYIYSWILAHYDEHGAIPDFSLKEKADDDSNS